MRPVPAARITLPTRRLPEKPIQRVLASGDTVNVTSGQHAGLPAVVRRVNTAQTYACVMLMTGEIIRVSTKSLRESNTYR